MIDFNCTSCGQCCRNISHISELKKFDNGNGVCKFLSKTNKCDIYDNRPDVCKIDIMYQKFYVNKISEIKFIELNAEACNTLQESAGIPVSFRVEV